MDVTNSVNSLAQEKNLKRFQQESISVLFKDLMSINYK